MNSTKKKTSNAVSPFDVLHCQPSTSSRNLRASSAEIKSHVMTFIYDISLELQVDIPQNDYNRTDIIAATSALLTAHIFVSHREWYCLSTPILRILDSALTRKKLEWESKDERFVTNFIIHIMGHLVNLSEKPTNSTATYDNLNYNGCVDKSKIMINYKMKFLFAPGILAAEKVYESHGWTSDDTTQEDDSRSLKLREILKHHQGNANFDHEWTWKEAFDTVIKGRTRKMAVKRKHKDAK